MSYNLAQAFQAALNVMRKELNEAFKACEEADKQTIDATELDMAEHEKAVLKARYEVYKSIVERLDCLI